jgi:hypothetical protein
MTRERVFTVYLPSNSPGAEPLHESEDKSSTISSYYKTTLDSTIDLTGEWSVGLAEVSSVAALCDPLFNGMHRYVFRPNCSLKSTSSKLGLLS